MFGKAAFLVDSLTKLSKIEFKDKEGAGRELQEDAACMSEDIRVIIIKFADGAP